MIGLDLSLRSASLCCFLQDRVFTSVRTDLEEPREETKTRPLTYSSTKPGKHSWAGTTSFQLKHSAIKAPNGSVPFGFQVETRLTLLTPQKLNFCQTRKEAQKRIFCHKIETSLLGSSTLTQWSPLNLNLFFLSCFF